MRLRGTPRRWWATLFAWFGMLIAVGCRTRDPQFYESPALEPVYVPAGGSFSLEPLPTVDEASLPTDQFRPHTAPRVATGQAWKLTFEQAVYLALTRSEVLRDVGGRIVQSPGDTRTTFDPPIVSSDPVAGVDAALAEFDGQFAAFAGGWKLDQPLNNQFQGNGTTLLRQDGALFWAGLNKATMHGTRLAVRHDVNYAASNSAFNRFPSAWQTLSQAEIRHPLLQGSGELFNQIAGPAVSGQYKSPNGLLLAQTNVEISRMEFGREVQHFLSRVADAYWNLYYARRALATQQMARDRAYEIWQHRETRQRQGVAGRGQAAQAKMQYLRFQADVQNAEFGVPDQAALVGGLFAAERHLRFLLGLPPSDGRILHPVDQPDGARLSIDPQEALAEALARRMELRRQQQRVEASHLELLAATNYLKPRLDVVAQYRWRGLGDRLAGGAGFASAYGSLAGGNFQDWQAGLEMQVPLGYRQAMAAVRNAELKLARQEAILKNQRLQVAHDVSGAITELERTYSNIETTRDAVAAAEQYREFARARNAAGVLPLFALLEAERDLAQMQLRFERSRVEYAIALKDLELKKGSILDYTGVLMAD